MEKPQIHQKVYDFMCWFFPIVDNFPKFEKFALCTRIKNTILDIEREILRANKSRNKLPHLDEIDLMLEELRLLIRFSHERKYLSDKKYSNSAKKVDEIGRMLGGWIKSCK